MKRTKLAASLLAVSLAVTSLFTGCNNSSTSGTSSGESSGNSGNSGNESTNTGGGESSTPEESSTPAPELTYSADTVLRMACGYNKPNTGLTFDAETAGEGVTLADGKTYNTGDFKPTWVTVMEKLNFKIEDKFQGSGGASKEFDYWKEQLDQVDMVSGTASQLSENGAAGLLVNIADYLDSMPNFKAYLEANPIVRLSITGSTTGANKGAIYFSPYFDGVDDIERMPLMRVDWVQKLLDGDEFTATSSGTTAAPSYQPYMPTSGKVPVQVVEPDGKTVTTINKDYDTAGNIVANMNAVGSMSGVDAVNMLRKYIDEAYGGYYGTTRSNLFVGQNAAWDADELVALLRCVCANAQTLNGTDTVQGLHSREDANNQRRVDMFRFAGTLFGVRGLESRQDYLYVGTDNKLHDARQEADTYEALERVNAMANEGLIAKAFLDTADIKTPDYLEKDLGFMHYDYNQTQTAYNETKLQDGEKYMAAMVPVARWYDGSSADGVYMRFTESWRSVKTDGWGISKQGVGDSTDKLNAALKLIDYAYSEEGQILMSYGPDAFIKPGATFNFNGKEMPVIADKTYEELWEKQNGNYTNYARFYLGSTLSFAKSQAFEFQCTHEVGREGAGYISNAIAAGTIKHPLLALADNAWYTSVPTVLPNTTTENNMISEMTELGNANFGQSSDQKNILVDMICGGYSGEGLTSRDATVDTVKNTWKGEQYLNLKNQAWDRLVTYYNETH